MYLVRKAPVVTAQIIIKRNETVPLTIKIGESAAIRMYPYARGYLHEYEAGRERSALLYSTRICSRFTTPVAGLK